MSQIARILALLPEDLSDYSAEELEKRLRLIDTAKMIISSDYDLKLTQSKQRSTALENKIKRISLKIITKIAEDDDFSSFVKETWGESDKEILNLIEPRFPISASCILLLFNRHATKSNTSDSDAPAKLHKETLDRLDKLHSILDKFSESFRTLSDLNSELEFIENNWPDCTNVKRAIGKIDELKIPVISRLEELALKNRI